MKFIRMQPKSKPVPHLSPIFPFTVAKRTGIISGAMGSCTPRKMQKILANQLFSQHAKLNMAGFALYLLDGFGLR